jgi:hypothetical protein
MRREGRLCRQQLDALGVSWKPGPATRKVATPVVVPEMIFGGVRLTSRQRRPPYVMDCRLAETLTSAVAPILTDLGVTTVEFGSIYDYRNVAGRRARSRHAIGMAIDIFAFVSADGARHVVKEDYRAGDLLRAIEERLRATGVFRGPLTPGNDRRRHHDHFHLEARTMAERRSPATS